MTEQDKVTVDDIIGIVKTEEQTNSVEEVRKLRGRENKTAKRFQIDDDGDISEFDSNGKWVDCWQYANGKHWNNLCNELNHLNDENKQLKKENEQLRKDLIDHSALILMLEDYQALKIEDTLYNLTGAESEEEFNELYKLYLDKAKKCWKGDVE